MRKIAILGSTGSIGTQTLEVIKKYSDRLSAVSLVAYKNSKMLERQYAEFLPSYTGLISRDDNALIKAVSNGADTAVIATKGITALKAVLFCLENNIDVALANKETLVAGGKLVTDAMKKSKSRLIPVDSEHSAILQCIQKARQTPKRLILTASGGAFRNKTAEELKTVDYRSALKHPNWKMGEKITIDSSTMFNKTLEVIEAEWFFDIPRENIDILINPQSVVHSLIELNSGEYLGQVSQPDMRSAIEFALFYPSTPQNIREIDMNNGEFEFYKPDTKRFPCVTLAYDELLQIPLMPTVMNAANDVCVEMFKRKILSFCDFWNIIHTVCERFAAELPRRELTLDAIEYYDELAKLYTENIIRKSK